MRTAARTMRRHGIFWAGLAVVCAQLIGAEAGFHAEEIAAPLAESAAITGPSLTMSRDGTAWLTWLENVGAQAALRCARFDPTTKAWTSPRTIASGRGWVVNDADFPTLTVGADGHATAVWSVHPPASATASTGQGHGEACHAVISSTTDAGNSWTAPAPLTRESTAVEFVALTTLADGRVLAAWLDGRSKGHDPRAPQQLRSKIIGENKPDTLVDPSVCDCCPITLTAFPDGSALLAYRGRAADETRDIRVTRFRHGQWTEPRALHDDGWKINGCPVNGPQLASDGGRIAVAWFTAAGDNPRVLASFSADAGTRFLLPLRIDHRKPAGRVATQLLHDGAMLITWVDTEGAVWLQRVNPDFAVAERIALGAASRLRARGFPRTALLRDFRGGKTEAQMLVVVASESRPTLRTLLVHIPEAELLEAEKNCECGPTAEELRGFSIRATVLDAMAPNATTVRVSHFEVPGIFDAGTRDFRLEPGLAGTLARGRQLLGRVEQRNGEWWLFDVRLLATPK